MSWTLERALRPSDPPRIATYEEHVNLVRDHGITRAVCQTGSARDALVRLHGFHIVSVEKVEEDFFRSPPAPDLDALLAGEVEPLLRAIEDGSMDWWIEEVDAAEGRGAKRVAVYSALHKRRLVALNPLRVQRAPLEDVSAEARSSWALEWGAEEARHLAIVMVVTGWTAQERTAVASAAVQARVLGATLVVVQNQKGAANTRAAGVVALRANGLGFGASSQVGADEAIARGARWILFTQADVAWAAEDVVGALAYQSISSSGGLQQRAASVGVSGGYIRGWPQPGQEVSLVEVGRNIEARPSSDAPIAVDWITGYWLLVDAQELLRAGGWCGDYRLYWEDVDLSLRLATIGSRSIVLPYLGVEHQRGSTIRRVLAPDDRETIRAASQETFLQKWRDRCCSSPA